MRRGETLFRTQIGYRRQLRSHFLRRTADLAFETVFYSIKKEKDVYGHRRRNVSERPVVVDDVAVVARGGCLGSHAFVWNDAHRPHDPARKARDSKKKKQYPPPRQTPP